MTQTPFGVKVVFFFVQAGGAVVMPCKDCWGFRIEGLGTSGYASLTSQTTSLWGGRGGGFGFGGLGLYFHGLAQPPSRGADGGVELGGTDGRGLVSTFGAVFQAQV